MTAQRVRATHRRIALVAPYTSRVSWVDAHPDADAARGIAGAIVGIVGEVGTWD